MCGIAGFFLRTGQAAELALLQRMAATIRHRGPDGEGFFLDQELGLAHVRLAILDLSAAGHQPMQSHSGRYWMTYNGEIYNYLELRQQLSAQGYVFRTQTDTEVILAAFEAYGEACVNYFNGMWAFAIWDQQTRTLFCSRDRFGIKPFYYYLDPHVFVFASEIKALLQHPAVPQKINHQTVGHYLFQGKLDHRAETFFEGIVQLMPAQQLSLSREGLHLKTYWHLPAMQSVEPPEPVETMRRLFENSLKLQVRSDVPVGSCLSGGLDSSAIVCTLAQISPQGRFPYQLFSACYPERQYDEREYIQQVVTQTGATAHQIFPGPAQLLDDLPHLIHSHDEPFISLSMFAQWCVMKAAAGQGIKVLLDGQGADELMAGYGYQGHLWADYLRTGAVQRLWTECRHLNKAILPETLVRMLFPLWLDRLKQLRHARQSRHLYHPDLAPPPQPFAAVASGHVLEKTLRALFHERLLSLLRYEDRNSMAFSIESRVPFLDVPLVEFVCQLPPHDLIREGWSKWILRAAMKNILPEGVRLRKDKMGFVTPQNQWFKHELREWVQTILHSSSFQSRPFWNARFIQQEYAHWLAGRSQLMHHQLWPILNLELWLQYYF
jgi:asparagine synthase (glutamine-hydrolysing)